MPSYYRTDIYGNYTGDAPNVTDGNYGTGYYLAVDPDMDYAVVCDYGTVVNVTQIRVYVDFDYAKVEYLSGSEWVTVGYVEPAILTTFNVNINTQKWRVVPVYYDTFVAEMSSTYTSGATQINVTDTGAGTENLSLTKIITDTGTGADKVDAITRLITDTGAGTDTVTASALIQASDSGTGTDSVSVTVTILVEIADSGTGSDAIISMIKGVGDSGTGAETVQGNMLIPVSDSGTGSDSVLVAINLIVTDTGFGMDGILPASRELVDGIVGDELLELTMGVGDTGQGSDAVLLLTLITLNDSGTCVDGLGDRFLTVYELGTLSDLLTKIWIVEDGGVGQDKVERVPHAALLAFFKELMGNGNT